MLAHGRGRRAGRCVKLSALSDVVREIASLPPKLLQELPKALAACQCAITLREHAAALFSGGDSGHQHFLQLLRGWHKPLRGLLSGQDADASESRRFENYYQVLQVDEDDMYFPDEELFVAEPGAPSGAKEDRERLFNEAFAEDLRLEVVYFFLELEELVEGVFSIYDQVKRQQRTMVEATVVVKLAMDSATALTPKLQLRYPALKTAEDVINIAVENTPRDYMKKMGKAVTDFWTKFQNNSTYTFVPGMLIVDFFSVGSTLASFTSVIPTQAKTKLVARDGFFGETYGEDRTPQYVLPDRTNMVVFLLQQLPLLFNAILETKSDTGASIDDSNLTTSFLALMDEYFTSRQVTVPVEFACVWWLKSVAALQGQSGLTRNVSLTFKHTKDLMKNMGTTVAKGAVFTADKEIHNGPKQCAEEIKMTSRSRNLARANPLMAGFMMLTYDFHYLHMASEILMVMSRFRAFGHLYNAFVEQGFLQHILFFDDVLEIYDEMIFTPSRAAAVHGSYNRAYLLSSHLTAIAVNAMYRGVPPPAGKAAVKVRKALHFRDLSKIYRLLIEKDKSTLGGASSKAMLDVAADICSKELFQTPTLSR
ncbi:Drug/Metabolite Transporter (DMT) Superfamily [Phytophthora cinnamomi]|uniref:Drug/Metabolite Transporter (DMT) Superfamily n=1 Tax=Phytophthora cinnamomi TaxID=4785 RepID=UPI00355A43F2|nr:Drug/Metabolite Transporter (DMT) Superfamily [Phytophthora cinnamomi]